MRPPETQEERERVIKDVVNHKIEEVVVGGGDDITPEEIEEFEEALRDANDEELVSWWTTVGEWVASRGLDPDEQYEKLLTTGDIDYGYMEYRYEHPY